MKKTTYVPRIIRGSGYQTTSNSLAIASGDSYNFTLDQRFIPYDDVLVVNLNSNNDCQLDINYGRKQPLPKGTNLKTDIPIKALRITNNGSTQIEVNEIEVYYRALSKKPQLIQGAFTIGGIVNGIRGLF